MAGRRNTIARWRRITHVAMVLCVQSVLAWLVLCGVTLTIFPAWNATIYVSGASVAYCRLSDLEAPQRRPEQDNILFGRVQWQWPRWLPAWSTSAKFGPGSALSSWELTLPLWAAPAAFGALTWYAAQHTNRLRKHACPTCGNDTRGLVADAQCRQCGTHCTVRCAACMAGTQRTIARWQRIRNIALVLCVQSVPAWLVLCGITLTVSPVWSGSIDLSRASVSYSRLTHLVPQQHAHELDVTRLFSRVQWQWPQWLPAWRETRTRGPDSPLRSWGLTLPLWPLPVAFGALAWYAGRKIKQLRPHVCATCGYDTRGLAAGACCPECGTACTV